MFLGQWADSANLQGVSFECLLLKMYVVLKILKMYCVLSKRKMVPSHHHQLINL